VISLASAGLLQIPSNTTIGNNLTTANIPQRTRSTEWLLHEKERESTARTGIGALQTATMQHDGILLNLLIPCKKQNKRSHNWPANPHPSLPSRRTFPRSQIALSYTSPFYPSKSREMPPSLSWARSFCTYGNCCFLCQLQLCHKSLAFLHQKRVIIHEPSYIIN